MIGWLLAAAVAAAPGWDQAFSARGARGGLELVAVFTGRDGQDHRVHLWRDGAARLRRDTEGTRLQVERAPRGGDDLYRVLRAGQAGYRVHQRNLFRIELGVDFGSLATLLQRPAQPVRVVALAAASPAAVRPWGGCRWSEVPARGLRVCWSGRLRIPLAVQEKRGETWTDSLRIETLREGPIAPAVFALPGELREIDLDEQAAGD